MCVFSRSDIVITCVQNVGLGIDVVVGLQLFLVEGDRHGLACTGSQLRGLGVTDQFNGSLFHLVGLVIIGVRALCVDFHNVLACNRTGVGDLDRHGAGIAIPAGVVIRPVKGGVGQAVAEGVHHSIVVVVIARIALTEDFILVTGLVVAVANIDALFVADVVVLGEVAILIVVGKVAEVLRRRAVHGIHFIGIHGAAGGVHLTGEDFCQRAQTVITHSGSRNDGVDIGIVFDPAQVYRCAGVQQQHHIIKVIVQILQDLQLGRIRLQISLGLVLFHIGVVVHGAGHITAFARHTAEHKDRHRALHGIGQARLRLHDGQRALVDGEVLVITVRDRADTQTVILAVAFGIEFPEVLVDTEPGIFKGRFHIDFVAADVADSRMADKAEGGIRAVRHSAFIVLQQDDALCCDLLVQGDLVLYQRFFRVKTGLAVLHVDAFGLGLAVVDAAALQPQDALHTAGVRRDQHVGRNYTARQCDTQHTRNGSFDDLAHHLTVLLFLCHNC